MIGNKQVLWVIGILVLVIPVALGLLLSSGDEKTVAELPAKISPQQYQDTFVTANAQHMLVDVRTPEEFAEGYIQGAVNISLQTLPDQLNALPTDQPLVLYCRSGNRSAQAAELLKEAGYTQVYDLGGIIDWQAEGFPVQK